MTNDFLTKMIIIIRISDAETYQAIPTYQIGGGVSLKVFIFEPDTTILTAWDKSYSFEIGPGKSWHVALSTKQFRDLSGFNDCVQEGELGYLYIPLLDL